MAEFLLSLVLVSSTGKLTRAMAITSPGLSCVLGVETPPARVTLTGFMGSMPELPPGGGAWQIRKQLSLTRIGSK